MWKALILIITIAGVSSSVAAQTITDPAEVVSRLKLWTQETGDPVYYGEVRDVDKRTKRIDPALAAKGGELYEGLCKGCHLPPVGTKAFWNSKAWLPPNSFNQSYLQIETKAITDIGTDPGAGQGHAESESHAPGQFRNHR
ncbi:hypothetical protein [Nitrobacter winogradskyi]|uniref:Cytochrome c5 n=1 Tax=Nitrobacter winogradskyi TaxID=913 RepID=A0ACC6APJ5_NITWI|nr:hypothetical protein [Nitrobacter winogradskyi]MCP2001206.1 cytochrome c5 [Nitrobacter winogradskyi]